ncbi:roundabout homolog 3-like [Lytechinus pictus]|uniref:roundabout homolog 3-like n=1 Tax=Lytechinus pictus TaxID=7653 RepID=UPI0030BA1ABA
MAILKGITIHSNMILSWMWLVVAVTSVGAISFREQPESITAIGGETVVLHCAVNNQADIPLYWQNLDTASYISLNRRMNPYGQIGEEQLSRFEVTGNVERGEYHLQITNVSKADEGRYACVFFLNFNYYSQVAKVRVVRPPDRGYPKCAIDPIQRANVGDNITLSCESRGGDPPATLSWVRGTTRLITKRGRHHKGDPIVHYSMTLTEEDSDVRFTCVATNSALEQPITCSLTPLRSSLGVLLRPVVASVEVGQAFTFACITERMPNLAYQWYINNELIDGRESRFTYLRGGQRLLIEAVTMEDDYALVKCEVTQKDYSYSGSAVGLLWVQSNRISTSDVQEAATEAPSPRGIATANIVTKVRATTTSAKATTAPTTLATTTLSTTSSPPTTTIPTTKATTMKPTSKAITERPTIPQVPLVVNDGNIVIYESSSSSSVSSDIFSSLSSVSSLSSDNEIEVPESETTGLVDISLPTETSAPTEASTTQVTKTQPPEMSGNDLTPTETQEETNANIILNATHPVENSTNNLVNVSVTSSTSATDVMEVGSGDSIGIPIDETNIFTDQELPPPNKTDRLRGNPNWGLIAGLFVVFLLVVVALSALAVFLYKKHGKEATSTPST